MASRDRHKGVQKDEKGMAVNKYIHMFSRGYINLVQTASQNSIFSQSRLKPNPIFAKQIETSFVK